MKLLFRPVLPLPHSASPSLRGSGLKLFACAPAPLLRGVSLFTREWIEMPPRTKRTQSHTVSLFTREWIEIISVSVNISGGAVSLFTREWIEIEP